MQEIDEIRRHTPTRLQQRFSLILQDLKSQLNDIDESITTSQSASDIAHIRTDSFSKIDLCRHWVIACPIDDYVEEPQERQKRLQIEDEGFIEVYVSGSTQPKVLSTHCSHEKLLDKCAECGAELDDLCQLYREKALCSQCYMNSEIVAVCNACHQAIEGRVVKALGKTWHPHHLVCSKCEMNLSGGPFYEENGRPLCFHHFRNINKEACHKCRNLLPESVVEFSNKLYCPDHFDCEFCDSPLKSG
nr:Four and a half LIM domains protein 3 [Hymenolepis microstoma]